MILERNLRKFIIGSIKQFPVVGLIGCRQVGKTTLAGILEREFGKKVTYLDLELPSDLAKLQDPELYLTQFTDSCFRQFMGGLCNRTGNRGSTGQYSSLFLQDQCRSGD